MAKINRKIQFYRVQMSYRKQQGNNVVVVNDHSQYVHRIFDLIDSLPFDDNDETSRYYRFTDGNQMSMYVDECGADKIRGRVVTCRRRQLPDVENAGKLTALPIPPEAGLAEITHFVYFFNSKIIGMEFNFFGPKASQLGLYIEDKLNTCIPQFLLQPILRPDLDPILKDPNLEITMFQVEAYRNAGEILKDLNRNLGIAFKVASKASDAEQIELVLRRKRYGRSGFWGKFLNLEKIVDRFHKGDKDKFNKLKLDVFDHMDGKIRPVDLLKDRMTLVKSIEQNNDRRKPINSESMYKAIESSYNELEDQLVF